MIAFAVFGSMRGPALTQRARNPESSRNCARSRGRSEAPVAAKPPADVAPVSVYFDYDTSELSPETRTVLQSFFDQARQRPDQDVRIEGNCDERGSREYNLALGQRRADAARNHLENLGLDPGRITTISNGKERPRASGHDEAAWRENRRDDLVPVGGEVGVSMTAGEVSR